MCTSTVNGAGAGPDYQISSCVSEVCEVSLRCSSVPFIALLLCRVISSSFINSLRMHRFTSSDIASTFPPDKQMGRIRDPRGGPGTQPLCSVLISCRGLRVKDRRWKSDWVVEISRFTGDNRLSIGKRARVRNSFPIRTSY